MQGTTWHEWMTGWRKSKYTHHEENACVEVGTGPGLVGVRDTKQRELPNTERPVLVFADSAFGALLDHLKAV